MNKPLLLPAPDKARYVLYKKPQNREAKFTMGFNVPIPPGVSNEQEKAMAEALIREHFLYLDEQIRKFWDDLNGMQI